MPFTNTTPTTTAETSGAWGGRARKPIMLRQRVNLTVGAGHVPLGQNLPARANVIWSYLINQAAVVVETTAGDGTNTSDSLALTFWPTTNTQALTVPTTGTASSVTNILGTCTNTSSNTLFRGNPVGPTITATARAQNTNTVPALLTIMPMKQSSNRVSFVTSGTAGFFFGTNTATSTNTAGLVDCQVYYEVYEDAPSY